jgi:hypothetical protein
MQIIKLVCLTLLCSVFADGWLLAEQEDVLSAKNCPPIVFVKRPHFDRPFGIGTIIGWDIYKPGGGICIYDPSHPEGGTRDIFWRNHGVIFDMSLSFDATKLLFAWRECRSRGNRKGPLSVSRVWRDDTLDYVMELSEPLSSAQKPNHSFWDRRGGVEWAEVMFKQTRKISEIAIYWFDDQPNGGCAIPQSWKLFYWQGTKWKPVEEAHSLGVAKNSHNVVRFRAIRTRGFRIELQCRPNKSAGIQRLRIGTSKQHVEILGEAKRDAPNVDLDCFHIYEMNVDGTGLRQLTYGPFQDIHPFYLPDGRIGFVSTRVKAYVMCQPGAACALHVMDSDGSNIRRIHFGTLADHSPFVLDNGSILFTRWEYQDKDLTYLQGLWTVNPDGTRVQLFYGNTIFEPAVIWQAKPIPETSKVLCTLAPHHGNPVGAVGIIDRSNGLENPAGIANLTPEFDYNPKRNIRGPGDRQYTWAYRDPYPIREDLFVVSYGGDDISRYRLYLMDDRGRKRLLYEDPKISCFNPLPLVPRKKPHTIHPSPGSDKKYGTFYVADIYRGLVGVKQGQVKAIRVMKVIPKPCNMRGLRGYDMDPLMSRGTYYAKYCLGTVPVDENGCAYFRAPAGVELYFQALDADGRELCRMGSVTQVMPGEMQRCIGCHESRFMAPPNRAAAREALGREPDDIRPPVWGAGPIDFVRQVQPVLDMYCLKCHSGPNPEGGIDLSGGKTRFFNMAYDTLTEKRLINYHWLLNEALVRNFRPMESGSLVSKLVEMIDAGHGDVNMDDESKRRIYNWIEANVPYYGTYDHTRPSTSGSRDACAAEWFKRFEHVYRKRCGDCHGKDFHVDNSGLHHTWINLTHPEWSRVLHAPLDNSAGGLALCKDRDKNKVRLFADTDDPDCRAMLEAITEGSKQLYARPRMDMDSAKPVPYPTNYAGPFSGFAGP